ncbi:MAG TPA: apolipoprotein N-acyltransferase [Bacteroidota bacterium]
MIDENLVRRGNILLAVAAGLMLGFAFPPSPLYSLAYLGLVPLMFLIVRIDRFGELVRYSYLSMLVFHLSTLYWVTGITHLRDPYLLVSGGSLVLIHPMFYWIPIVGAAYVRRRLGNLAFLIAFPVLWVGFEYAHSLGEVSFPWLTLGNSQAYDVNRIQIVDVTSVYGLSLLVVIFNTLSFVLLRNVMDRRWTFSSPKSLTVAGFLVFLYVVPLVYGAIRRNQFDSLTGETAVSVGIVQPNIDPYEKWGEGFESKWESYVKQLTILYEETRKLSKDSLDLVVWPETAIPFYILLPQNAEYFNQLKHEIDLGGTPVFTGIPDGQYMDSAQATASAKWIPQTGKFFEGYNAATLFVPYQMHGPVYRKVLLVPFAERVPYAETVPFLIDLVRWSVGLGSWGKGTERLVYSLKTRGGDTTRFAGMICYELVFPSYVRSLAERGAEFMLVLSNDSWWGNTSGARQLAAYTVLRAVETRKWIVRCANGGISGMIDPAGRMYNETGMFEAATFSGTIKAMDKETFYVRHGDILGMICLIGALASLALSIVRPFKQGGDES